MALKTARSQILRANFHAKKTVMTKSNITAVQKLLNEAEALQNDLNQLGFKNEADENPALNPIREALNNVVYKLQKLNAISTNDAKN